MSSFSKKKKCLLGLVLVCGALFLVMGLALMSIVHRVIDSELDSKLPIVNGSFAYQFWQKPPVPVEFALYVFDVLNPKEVEAGTEVPSVVEKGPYVYMMDLRKTDIEWHDNGTVSYIQIQSFHFNREASVGPDTDTFTSINIPYITVATILRYESKSIQKLVDAYMRSQYENAFIVKSVRDIWWGYEEPVLEEIAKLLAKHSIHFPFLTGKFGFYTDKNNTGDGLYNVYSGAGGNFDKYLFIDRWNGMRNLSEWTTDYANEIRGTDGSQHAPGVTEASELSMFDSYLQRSLKLEYNKTETTNGIRTLQFRIPFSEFESGIENPDTLGFCTPDEKHCIPSGAYNFSSVCYGAPIYISLPHFVGGDPYYQRQVTGMSPDSELHQPFYDIQALTGVSMKAARRYQINVRAESYEHFTAFATFPTTYIPVLWIDGVASLDSATAALFRDDIQQPLDAMPWIKGTLIILGSLLLVGVVGLFAFWKYQQKTKLYRYHKVDEEKKPLNKRKKKFGTADIQGPMNSKPEDVSETMCEEPVANGHAGSANNNKGHGLGDELQVEPPSRELLVDLEGSQSHDLLKEESQYFDPKTSASPEPPETYQSFREV